MSNPALNSIRWRPFDPATIGVQTLTGAGSVAVMAAIAALIGPQTSETSGMLLASGGAAAAAISFPTGFYFGGKWIGGNGSYILTLLRGLGGGGLAMLATGTKNKTDEPTPAQMLRR